jgi:predicted enzyme related to lactoylglutathione lyase
MFGNTNAYSSFAVDDVERAREFYGDTLGIETSTVEEMPGGLLILNLAGGRDTLVYPKPDYVPATYTVLNFAVDDVEKAVDDLTSRGVSFDRYDGFGQDDKGIARGNGPDIAWFRDPAGNVLSVVQAGPTGALI